MQLDGADVLRHTHKARQTRMVTHTRRALAWIFESAPAHTTPQFSIESSPHPSHSLASNSQFSCLVQACCHTLANAGSSADISGSTSASVALLCALAVAGQPAVHADARYAPAVSALRSVAFAPKSVRLVSPCVAPRNVLALASTCICFPKHAKTIASSSSSALSISVPNSTASTYIMLVRSLCLPPPPLKQTLEAPPPSLLHALAVLVTQDMSWFTIFT